MNFLKLKLPVLAVLVLISLSEARYDSDELTPKKLAKSYAKINKYLEKNLGPGSQQDAQTIMIGLKQLRAKKSSSSFCRLFGDSDGSMGKTAQQIIDLPLDSHIGFQCDRSKQKSIYERLDAAWAEDETKLTTPNYPLTHLDRLIEHLAMETVRVCDYNGNWPRLEFAFKQRAYDQIGLALTRALPQTADPEANMNQLQEMLAKEPKQGVWTEAMKQLLALRSLPSSCHDDQRAHDTLLRNDLALKGGSRVHRVNSATQGLTRLEGLFRHYVVQHELLCRPTVLRSFRQTLSKLNENTFKQVLGLAASHYLKVADYKLMALSLRELDTSQQIFSLPQMDNYLKQRLAAAPKSGSLLSRINTMNVQNLRHFLDALRTSSEDKAKDKARISDQLINPCGEFLTKFEKLVTRNEYGVPAAEVSQEDMANTSDYLTYHMVHAGYQACKYVLDSRVFLYDKLSDLKWY